MSELECSRCDDTGYYWCESCWDDHNCIRCDFAKSRAALHPIDIEGGGLDGEAGEPRGPFGTGGEGTR